MTQTPQGLKIRIEIIKDLITNYGYFNLIPKKNSVGYRKLSEKTNLKNIIQEKIQEISYLDIYLHDLMYITIDKFKHNIGYKNRTYCPVCGEENAKRKVFLKLDKLHTKCEHCNATWEIKPMGIIEFYVRISEIIALEYIGTCIDDEMNKDDETHELIQNFLKTALISFKINLENVQKS